MEFWSELLTQKSWTVLLDLKKRPFAFIVIGGWAAYLWTRLHKSKDVDIVLRTMEDLRFLKENYELKKNDRLKKYEIAFGDIDVDIYVPYYSALAIPAQDLHTLTSSIEGITVVIPEALLILKQGAELDRADSVKGSKDRVDIMALLCFCDIDFGKYNRLLARYRLETYRRRLQTIIRGFDDLRYLGLTPRQYKLKKKALLGNI